MDNPIALVFFLIFCVLVGWYAQAKKGRSFWGWAGLAFLVSPLISFIICAIMKPKEPEKLAPPTN